MEGGTRRLRRRGDPVFASAGPDRPGLGSGWEDRNRNDRGRWELLASIWEPGGKGSCTMQVVERPEDTMTAIATPATNPPTSIEMLTPLEAGLRLQLDADALLAVVDRGLLPAYDLGGHIRFRALDVARVAREFAAG